MRILHLTHTDLDGVACSVLLRLCTPYSTAIDTVYCDYNSTQNPTVDTALFNAEMELYDLVLITDISPSPKSLDIIGDIHCSVVVLDHHKSALWLNEYDWAHIIIDHEPGRTACGASLLLDYLEYTGYKINHNIRDYVELVRLYDTWDWEHVETYLAQSAIMHQLLFSSMSYNRTGYIKLMQDSLKAGLSAIEIAETEDTWRAYNSIKNTVDKCDKSATYKVMKIDKTHYTVIIIFSCQSFSIVATKLLESHPEADFLIGINTFRETLEFRTRSDIIDVSEIAALYGGGGHQKASGCPMTTEMVKSLLDGFIMS